MMKKTSFVALALILALSLTAFAKDDASGRAQAMIDKGIDFLKTQQQPDGGWQTGNQPPAVTAPHCSAGH